MNWKPFHHPNLCLPIIRRRTSEEFLDIVAGVGEIILTRGRSAIWSRTYPAPAAYRNALCRLQRQGLLIHADPRADLPRLILTETAKQKRPDCQQPEYFWNTKWNGIWYTLIFDVPEKERSYRDTLRRLLQRWRLGCLQKSVWITPRDIRPQYDDLEKSAAIGTVAYLLESRTVLHLDQQEMVQNAWDFSRLHELHSHYLDVFKDNLNLLNQEAFTKEDLMELLYQESEAYMQAMRKDPLLPSTLLPKDYLGKDVWKLRNLLRSTLADLLQKT